MRARTSDHAIILATVAACTAGALIMTAMLVSTALWPIVSGAL